MSWITWVPKGMRWERGAGCPVAAPDICNCTGACQGRFVREEYVGKHRSG